MTSTTLVTVHRTEVTEDQIDHLGHMNVRYYGLAARAATWAVVDRLRPTDHEAVAVDVPDVYTRHLNEQLLGARLSVRSGVLELGPRRLRLYHELVDDETGVPAATFVHHARVAGSAGVPWVSDPVLALPEIPNRGRPRSIDLDVGEQLAPALDLLRERDLAMRLPRLIGTEEVGDDGSVAAVDAPMLIWGGEAVEPGSGATLHPGPNGELIGWANLENRMRINRMPRVGDRIESFGVVLAVADKTTHRLMWAYDVDAGDVLCSFETVDLAFDTLSRRGVSIPDDLRQLAEARVHPDLRPGA